ncbi:MAG TPA: bifunctional diguanylate cyclase/phosphodiesterase, partial [Mesorhizobium sp.]
TISVAATCLALLTLMYMRSIVVHNLKSAAAAEAEKTTFLTTDMLTGAMTRRYFLEALQERLDKKADTALILLDLDHFKQLNDTFGHQFGDLALSQLVATARQVFDDGTMGRLGGDEFGIFVEHADEMTILRDLRRLLKTLQAGKPYEGKIIPLSFSAGVALAPKHGSRSSDLMLLADLALYESKAKGRGRATLFNEEMQSDQRYRRLVERELRAAVYLNELVLHYQPIVNADGSTYALEGLIRWRHSVRGIISPAEFIPIAERSTLIDMVGEWVFKRACADIVRFPGKRISINVSGEQLKRDAVVTMFERLLRETGRSASQFVLEITETVATAASPEILKRLETLRDLGFRIALDDFGTGHCGFNYLKTFPIDSIKIDRSYINSLATDRVAQVFVSALAQIARVQDVTIVAEGVETAEEFALARAAGCTRFQGYYISRPAPHEQLRRLDFNLEPKLPLSA